MITAAYYDNFWHQICTKVKEKPEGI